MLHLEDEMAVLANKARHWFGCRRRSGCWDLFFGYFGVEKWVEILVYLIIFMVIYGYIYGYLDTWLFIYSYIYMIIKKKYIYMHKLLKMGYI